MKPIDVIIVGGGLSGLSCAYYLQKQGLHIKLFEVASNIGGRTRSDEVDGFILDRGLHFYHNSTTELKKIIDTKSLNLKNSYPGYLLRYDHAFHLFTNPLYHTFDTVSTALAPNATLKDKVRLFGLYMRLRTTPYRWLVKEEETSTHEFLSANGFSKKLIDTFFRPMIASTIFDWNLQSSSRFSKIYLKSLFEDQVALPEKGIGSIAHAIAQKLEPATICLRSKIKQVTSGGVEFANGDFLPARMVVIATNAIDLDQVAPEARMEKACTHVSTIYFESDRAPISKPVVLLNGDSGGLVNHVFVPTTLQPAYAPAGKHLISVNVVKEHDLDDEELVAQCQLELSEWFGLQVNDWHHLKTYHIKYAMPFKPIVDEVRFTKRISETVYYCGDSLSVGTMESALRSGRETADAVGQVIGRIPMPAVSIAV